MKKRLNGQWCCKKERSKETRTLQVPLMDRSVCPRLRLSKRSGLASRRSRGQQIIEYALVIAAISAALTGMYVYMKRGLQARIKEVVDNEIGPQINSAPLVMPMVSQTSVSTVESLTNGSTRVKKSDDTADYTFGSIATSSGEAVMISNQVIK